MEIAWQQFASPSIHPPPICVCQPHSSRADARGVGVGGFGAVRRRSGTRRVSVGGE
jgi:hypothetical protein